MKISRGLVGLVLLVAALLAVARTSDGAPATGDPVAGEQAFTEYCSVCHGVGGKGFIGPKIGGVNWTATGLHAIVRGGAGGYGGMPAFNADAVTDRNIADIAAYLAALAPTPPPQASTSPSAQADTNHGLQVYTANCAACHGASAQGGVGPSLRGEKTRKDTAAAIAWIKHPQLPMPTLYPTVLSEKDVDDVAAYVESL
jgi:mono/diheme cytochrome c family protein